MSAATRYDVLGQASRLVNGDRNKSYDEPAANFARIAALWSAYLGIKVSATDVAAMNVLHKIARLMHTPDHWDSWVDIAGYAACGADVSLAGAADDGEMPTHDTPLGRITSLTHDGNGVRMEGEVYPEWASFIKQRTEGTK